MEEQYTELKDRVALVTGGSKGIGAAIAAELAKRGASVAIIGRNSGALVSTAAAIKAKGGKCILIAADIAREESALHAAAVVREKLGQPQILVNNAGIYRTSPVENHPTSVWQETIETNLTAPFLLSRELLTGMLESGWGRIINISSISGKVGEIHAAAYSASKFGLIGLTQSLALEVADKGITVNAVCPGWVNTEMAHKQLSSDQWCKLNNVEESRSKEMAEYSVPQLRFIEPDEVAHLVCYLCSDAARGITGQALNICGGMCLS